MADDGIVNVGRNENNNIKSGIGSKLQYNQAQRQLNDLAFNDNGLLQNMLQQTQQILKLNKDLSNIHDKMTKSERQRYAYELAQLRKIKKETQDLYDKGEASADDIIKLIDQSSKSYGTIYNDNLKAIQRQIAELEKKKDLEDDEIKQLEYMKQLEDQILMSQIQQEHSTERNTENIKEYTNILKTNTNSWAKGMSETLGSVSSTLSGLANMFNINKLANSGLNQFISTKLDLQNQIMKDFGITTKNEYISFKNDLNSTLNDMGNLFNSSDLKTYMGNLSKLGITDTKMAEQMAKSSMTATKYLGVSNETQEMIFKYMKRTNDYSMLDEHNKTITSILQAQLGISREQLDSLTTIAYGNDTTLASLGMDQKTLQAINEAEVTNMAALKSAGLDENTISSLNDLYSQYLAMDITERGKFAQYLGPNANLIYQTGWNDQSVEGQARNMQTFINSLANSDLLNMGGQGEYYSSIQKSIQGVLGNIDTSALAGLRTYLDLDTYGEGLTNALENRDFANPSAFVEDTTELTAVDEIANMLDKFINGLPWENMTGLVIAAARCSSCFWVFWNYR